MDVWIFRFIWTMLLVMLVLVGWLIGCITHAVLEWIYLEYKQLYMLLLVMLMVMLLVQMVLVMLMVKHLFTMVLCEFTMDVWIWLIKYPLQNSMCDATSCICC